MQNMLECRRSFHGYTMLIIDYLAYRDSFSSSFDVNLLCSGVDSQVTYTKLSTLLKMSVNPNATTGYLFCAHCNENVNFLNQHFGGIKYYIQRRYQTMDENVLLCHLQIQRAKYQSKEKEVKVNLSSFLLNFSSFLFFTKFANLLEF